jgi:hypothetical protein
VAPVIKETGDRNARSGAAVVGGKEAKGDIRVMIRLVAAGDREEKRR